MWHKDFELEATPKRIGDESTQLTRNRNREVMENEKRESATPIIYRY